MMLNEKSLKESVKKSCEFVERCIIESSDYDYPAKGGLLEVVLKELNNVYKVKNNYK